MGDQHEPGNMAPLSSKTKRWAWAGALGAVLTALLTYGRHTSTPTPDTSHEAEYRQTCEAIWQEELGRPIDPPALEDCLRRARAGAHEPELRQPVHDSPEAAAYRASLETPPTPVLTHAGESGPLHVVGLSVRDDQDREWRYRGFTDFTLFKRYLNGDDIQPVLTERIAVGANTLRVLMAAGALFQLQYADYTDAQLDAFLSLLGSRGLRCECVVLVDANPDLSRYQIRPTAPTLDAQRAALSRLSAVFARHWNVIGELANEASHLITRVDRSAFTQPPGPTLWERGSGQADEPPFAPIWSVVGDHPGRQDDWPRRLNCRDIRSNDGPPWGIRAPCWENEPMGAAEVNQPGRRATNPDDFRQFAALAALNSNGALFHSDAGILSQPLGPVQKAAAVAFFDALKWVPLNAPLWPYRRGGLSGASASCTAHSDSSALRTFSKDNGAECWTVIIRGTVPPVGVDGWRIVETHANGLVRLAK